MKTILLYSALLLTLAACGGDRKPQTEEVETTPAGPDPVLVATGRDLFYNRSFGEVDIACIDCHADHPDTLDADNRIRPGHAITGAARRTSTWNGEFSGDRLASTAAGAAKCVAVFQQRTEDVEDALSKEEAAALMAYYAFISTGSEPVGIPWTAVSYPGDPAYVREQFKSEVQAIEDLRGDADRGSALFDRACGVCHGPNGRGNGPTLKILRKHLKHLPAAVRRGEENMPFFARDKLSNQDIADIRAFVAAQR